MSTELGETKEAGDDAPLIIIKNNNNNNSNHNNNDNGGNNASTTTTNDDNNKCVECHKFFLESKLQPIQLTSFNSTMKLKPIKLSSFYRKGITHIESAKMTSISARMIKEIYDIMNHKCVNRSIKPVLRKQLSIMLKPCLMNKMGIIETRANTMWASFQWLFRGLLRTVMNIFLWPIWCLILAIYCIYLVRYLYSEHKCGHQGLVFKFIFIVCISYTLFYWHFWSFISIVYLRQPWHTDIILAYFMELSFDFILARIVNIITNNNKHDIIIQIFERQTLPYFRYYLYRFSCILKCLPKDVRKVFKFQALISFLPHKYSHELVSFEYFGNKSINLHFNTDLSKDTISAVDLIRFCEKDAGGSVCMKLFLILSVIAGTIVTWIGYYLYRYEYPIDLVVFTIWFVYYTYLLWSYFEIHLYSQFFIYLNKMRILNEIINTNFCELTDEFVEWYKTKQNKKIKKDEATILLSDLHNIRIWYDVWSEIRRNSRDYFDRQKYYIILIFILLLCSIIFGIVRILTNKLDYNEDIWYQYDDIHLVFVGAPALVTTILSLFIFMSLLYLSFQYPKTQEYQLSSLQDQHYCLSDIISQMSGDMITYDCDTVNHKLTRLVSYLKEVNLQLKIIKESIKIKKISPTIGGISMDHFLIRLFWTGVVSILSVIFGELISKNS